MAVLRGEVDKDEPLDMLVTNYVYDKVGKRNKHVVNFRHAMEPGRRLTWDDLGHFGLTEYILMHALIYRTAVVRESKMQLPEHTFYVDFIYASPSRSRGSSRCNTWIRRSTTISSAATGRACRRT